MTSIYFLLASFLLKDESSMKVTTYKIGKVLLAIELIAIAIAVIVGIAVGLWTLGNIIIG